MSSRVTGMDSLLKLGGERSAAPPQGPPTPSEPRAGPPELVIFPERRLRRAGSSEADGGGHGLQVLRRGAEVDAGRLHALVQAVQDVLLAVADGAEDLVRLARHRQAGLAGMGLGHGHLGGALLLRIRFPRGAI